MIAIAIETKMLLSFSHSPKYNSKTLKIGMTTSLAKIGGENNIRYIQFKKMKKAISLSTSNIIEVTLTKEGDSVDVKYINSNESALTAIEFKNLTNHIELSKNQENVKNQVDARISNEKKQADIKDANQALDTLSDSQKLELYKELKKNNKK